MWYGLLCQHSLPHEVHSPVLTDLTVVSLWKYDLGVRDCDRFNVRQLTQVQYRVSESC